MSSPIQPSGDRISGHGAHRGVGGEAIGHNHVGRQHQLAAPLRRIGHRPAGDPLPLVVLVPRIAHVESLRGEERERHRAADQDRVGELREPVDDADLVGHLDAAEDDHERVLRGRRAGGGTRSARPRAGGPPRTAAGVRRPRSRHGRGARRRRRRSRTRRRGRRARRPAPGRSAPRAGRSAGSRAAAAGRRSPANATGSPSSSAIRSATGRSDSSGTTRPFGRPRCEQTTTRAERSRRYLIVGSAARMRESSVIVVPSSGTFRSARTSTRLPSTGRSRIVLTPPCRRDRPPGTSIPTRCRTTRRP